MKNLRRMLAVFITVLMVMGFASSAFANSYDYTVEVYKDAACTQHSTHAESNFYGANEVGGKLEVVAKDPAYGPLGIGTGHLESLILDGDKGVMTQGTGIRTFRFNNLAFYPNTSYYGEFTVSILGGLIHKHKTAYFKFVPNN